MFVGNVKAVVGDVVLDIIRGFGFAGLFVVRHGVCRQLYHSTIGEIHLQECHDDGGQLVESLAWLAGLPHDKNSRVRVKPWFLAVHRGSLWYGRVP